jgi:Zn-dependent protease with chaperone function
MDARRLTIDQLVHPRERVLFAMMVLAGLAVYAALAAIAAANAQTAGAILIYALMFAGAGFLVHAMALGRIRGNGVLVSERQFPLLHQMVAQHAQRLGLGYTPTTYVLQAGGILNAFATKMLGRKFIIIYADVLALAMRRGEAAVSFIVGHEVGHHWRGHLKWRWLTAPARLIPYLWPAYSRCCEYTCDRVGAFCAPDGAMDGLLVLAAGNELYAHVDVREFAAQAESDKGYWIRRAEIVSTHPHLPKRVAALLALGVPTRATEPLKLASIAA